MSTVALITVSCDGCDDGSLSTVENTPAEARVVASVRGWTSGRGKDYCPTCSRRRARGMSLQSTGGRGGCVDCCPRTKPWPASPRKAGA